MEIAKICTYALTLNLSIETYEPEEDFVNYLLLNPMMNTFVIH